MEFELWYLIAVPLLFGAGWFFRGLDAKQGREENTALPDNYFRGLSHLLSNEPDKAIDAFIEVVNVDTETSELYHALGNLFCRRGEFDRAIRIHTHLINRADLRDDDRLRALSELANDYLKAGIFDKAEECFERLSKNESHKLEARRSLLQIACTEHDWNKAVATARKLEQEASEDHSADISHFYCELAELALRYKKPEEAAKNLQLALIEKPLSPRALILSGDMTVKTDPEKAVASWEKLRTASEEHFPLVVRRLVEGYEALGKNDMAVAVLEDAMNRCPSAEVVDMMMRRKFASDGAAVATEVMSRALSEHPTLGVLSDALELRKLMDPEDKQLEGITAMLKKESDRQGRYQCRKCGFLSHGYLWQCPGCGGWDTYPTRRVQDLSVKK